jgi:nicotinamidase-related amidase
MRTVDEVMEVLRPHDPLQVIKETRSTFRGDQDLVVYFKERGIEEVHLVGTETHDCVLAKHDKQLLSSRDNRLLTYAKIDA